jgi:hypothetical protein
MNTAQARARQAPLLSSLERPPRGVGCVVADTCISALIFQAFQRHRGCFDDKKKPRRSGAKFLWGKPSNELFMPEPKNRLVTKQQHPDAKTTHFGMVGTYVIKL